MTVRPCVSLLLAALCCAAALARIERRCYSQELERYFKNGADWTEPSCRQARCRRGRVLLRDCPPLEPAANCHPVPGQTGAEYPDCCPTLHCDQPGEEKPCYVAHLDRHFAVGETWTIPGCGQAICREGGAVAGKGCGAVAVPPGVPCGLDDGEPGLEYPQCCPKITCPACHSPRLDRFFGPDDVWTETGCIRSQCQVSPDGSVAVSRLPCGLLAPPFPDCEFVNENPDADYPSCCGTFRCPGRCFSRHLDRWFSVGDEWTEEGCLRAHCSDTDKMGGVGCPVAAPGPNCRLVDGNATANYPDCCPNIQCDPVEEKPCYDADLDRRFAVGEKWTLSGCNGQASCDGPGIMAAKGCPLSAVPPGVPCGLDDGEPGLEYPQCCPKITCPACHSPRLDRFFGPDDEWTETGCTRSRCQVSPDGSVAVSRLPCGLLAPPFPDCEFVNENPDADYPSCCGTFRCPGRCFSRHLDRWFSVGDEWTEEGCLRAHCSDTDEMGGVGCPVAAPGPNCRLVDGNATANYPDCCPNIQCDPVEEKPCYDADLDRRFAVGEKWTLSGCNGQATCDGPGIMAAKGCPLSAVPRGVPCGLDDGEPGLEYPQCCPKITCPACHSPRLDRFFGPDDVWTETGCTRSQCQVSPDGSVAVSRLPCGLLAPPFPDCEFVNENPDADYPSCCGTFRCPGGCFSRHLDRWFSVGDEWTEEGCLRAHCNDTDEMGGVGCPVAAPGPNCRLVDGNATANYPDCCPNIQCDPVEEKPCYDADLDRRFAVGEKWTLSGCNGQASCDGPGIMAAKGCPLLAFPPGVPCGLDDGEPGLEYPQCCPKITCPACHSPRLDRFFGPDDVWTETGCIRSQCQVSPDGSVAVSRLPCGLLAPPFPDCEFVNKNPDADYPSCCGTFRCPGRCFSRHLDRWFSVGDEWTEEGCTKASCFDTDGVGVLGCPAVALLPHCRLLYGNTTDNYPDCCPTVQCEEKPCYDADLDRRFAVGEKWTLSGCNGQATCDGPGIMAAKGCPLSAVPPGVPCGLDDGEPGLEYPQCCPKVTCPACHSLRLDRFFGPGEVWTETGCIRSQCQVAPDGSVVVSRLQCGLLAPPPFPDCEIVEKDSEADYPSCCPAFRCPGRCFSRHMNRWFSVGDEWTEEGCLRARCIDTDRVLELPCGSLALPFSDCEIVEENPAADYPMCCPTFRCPGRCHDLDRWLSVGDEWTAEGCLLVRCTSTNRMPSLPCPSIALDPPPNCRVVHDEGATYPACCPTIQCDLNPY